MVAGSPEIIECRAVTGEADDAIKRVARDMKACGRFLQADIFKVGGVARPRPDAAGPAVGQIVLLPPGSGTWSTHPVADARRRRARRQDPGRAAGRGLAFE